MIRLIIAAAAALALYGCASTPDDDGYQFGDVYQALKTQQADYCATTNPFLRAALLTAIRAQVPGYPPSGLCTDADQALADEIARRAADLPEGAVVDIEQARDDQRRFEEQADADTDSPSAADDAPTE